MDRIAQSSVAAIRMKRKAGDERAREFQIIKKQCQDRVEAMRGRFGDLTASQLGDLELWREFVHPVYFPKVRYYRYMGRRLTVELIRLILEDEFISYISGNPGYGKTTSLLTAYTYLYLRSVKAMETMETKNSTTETAFAKGKQRTQGATSSGPTFIPVVFHCSGSKSEWMHHSYDDSYYPDVFQPEWNPDPYDVSTHRFVLLPGIAFVRNACRTLFEALILAYVKDPEALLMLEDLDADCKNDLSAFLSKRNEIVHIILDEGNALDIEDTDCEHVKILKCAAFGFLQDFLKNNVRLVVCASVRSNMAELMLNESAKYHVAAGGFSEEEVCKYLSRITGNNNEEEVRKLAKSIHHITGWVPRLVFQFVLDKQAYSDTIDRHCNHLLSYIYRVEKEDNRMDMTTLITAIAGGRIYPFSTVLDTRCYFLGPDGRAQCLTPYLHSRAVGLLAGLLREQGMVTVVDRVDRFIEEMMDYDLVRIGWNAEAATLLVLRLMKPCITGLDLIIKPDMVEYTRKGRIREQVENTGKMNLNVLYIPQEFNHAGVNVYYVTPEAVLVIQITIAANPEKCHPKTEEVARALFQGCGKRVKALVWNVVTDRTRIEQAEDFSRVYIPFGDLHPAIACIDRIVTTTMRRKTCLKCEAHGGPGERIVCAFCGDWYHINCVDVKNFVKNFDAPWYCPDCNILLSEEDVLVDEEDLLGV